MIKTILRMIYPSSCIFCNKALEFNQEFEICESCYAKLNFFDNNRKEELKDERYYNKVFATFLYDESVKELIKEYKYKHKPYLFRTFAKLMFDHIKDANIKADVMLSVPLYTERERERGYNQAHLIAKYMSRLMGIQYYDNILKRIKTTNSLALCNKEQRSNIIKGAFMIENSDKVNNKDIIIIDDVFTTGVTINECSKVLKLNGSKNIFAIVLAKTD